MPKMKFPYINNILLLSLLSIFTGCSKQVDETEIPGIYIAEYPFATETVTINNNGKFVQSIKVKVNNKVVTTNGSWRFDPNNKDVYFSKEFMVIIDGFGEMIFNFDNPTRRAISILPVQSIFGKVQIGVDPRIPYIKQSNKGSDKGSNNISWINGKYCGANEKPRIARQAQNH